MHPSNQRLEAMQTLDMKPDVFTYNRVIRALRKAGESDKAMEIFSRMTEASVEPDAITYDSLAQDPFEFHDEPLAQRIPRGQFDADLSMIDALPHDDADGTYSIVVAAAEAGGDDDEDVEGTKASSTAYRI